MLRAIALAGLMALLLPAFAVAQEHQNDHRGGPPRGAPHGAPGGPPHGPSGGPPHARPAFVPHAGPGGPGGPPHGRPAFAPGPHLGPAAGAHFGPGGRSQFGYHGHFFNPVRISPFIYPPGYAYRRWAVGSVLPPFFLAPNYYYSDWATLGLDPPPPGTQWVRYGPDLLLVDVASGNVIEVVPDVFYE
jgi:Nickel/cobalt transporter regulator